MFEIFEKRAIEYLKGLIEARKVSQAELARQMEVTPAYINRLLKEDNQKISENVIDRITGYYPDAFDFIMQGDAGDTLSEPPSIYYSRPKPIPSIQHDPKGKKVPVMDTDVYASIIPSLSDSPTLKASTFISIPMFSQGEAAVQVTGHSMKGMINHGDWAVIKRITHHSGIVPGEAHLIVTKEDNIKTIKYIKNSDKPGHIRLAPYNTDQFEAYDIRLDDILDIFRIIGIFRVLG